MTADLSPTPTPEPSTAWPAWLTSLASQLDKYVDPTDAWTYDRESLIACILGDAHHAVAEATADAQARIAALTRYSPEWEIDTMMPDSTGEWLSRDDALLASSAPAAERTAR